MRATNGCIVGEVSLAISGVFGRIETPFFSMGERARELMILICGDIFFFVTALWLTLAVRYFSIPSYDLFAIHLGPFLIISTVWLFIFYIAGLYDKQTIVHKSSLFLRILYTQVANVLVAAVLFFIIPFGIAPKTNLVIYLVLSVALITAWRMRLNNFVTPKTLHRAILLADGPEAISLVEEINNNTRYNYSFVRLIDRQTAEAAPDFEEKLLKLIEAEKIDIIVASPGDPHVAKFLPTLFELAFIRFEITFLDFYKVYEETFDRIPLSSLRAEWFIAYVSQSRNFIYAASKRFIDVVGAAILLVPALFLFPLAALAIKIEDRGPLFYSTTRIGQYNRPITIFKLRTKNGTDSSATALNSTLVDTRVGKVLRKTRIDELPQLINVLKGDLSFIGPRPEIPTLAEVYSKEIPFYNARHFLKPGLSGWAQINNYDVPRGGVDVERTKSKLSYDLYYLKRRSLLLDVQIALKTFATIVMRTGT